MKSKIGVSDVNFEIKAKISKFKLKNKVDLFRLLKFMLIFFQKYLIKSIRIVLKYYSIPVSNISLPHKKSSTSRNKDILNTVLTHELTKIVDFEHFLLKILPPKKIVPCKSCFYLNKGFFIACCFVWIALFRFAHILSL